MAKSLRDQLKQLDPRRINLLREFYYKIANALPQLAEELEFAEIDLECNNGPISEQTATARKMLEAFDALDLGKHL